VKESFDIKKWMIPNYHRVVDFSKLGEIKRTGLDKEELISLGKTLTTIPDDFNINPQIKKIYEARRKSLESGDGIDFGTAESLAFASLLK
jgi:2-oxoglutarate dehydrogenase E1 component